MSTATSAPEQVRDAPQPKSRVPMKQGLQRLRGAGLLTWAVVVICLVLFVWPVAMIVLGAFRTGYPGGVTTWSLDPFVDVYTSSDTRKSVSTSVKMALLVTVFSKVLSFYFAWMVARTNTALRGLVTPVLAVSLAVPPLFFVLSWAMLGQERVGLLNRVAGSLFGVDDLVDVNSFAGIVFVCSLKSVAFGYFLLLGPMLALSRPMEEAAAVAGARKFKIFRSVTLPVMFPAFSAVLIMGFVRGLEYFEAPLILGKNASINVISTDIYHYLNDTVPPAFGNASALALLMMVALGVLLWVQHRMQRRRNFETQSGKGSSVMPWDLGRWKYVGTVVFLVFFALALVLPAIQLMLVSFQPYFGAGDHYSLDNYRALFEDPTVIAALRNTLLLGVLAGLAVMVIALVVVFATRHGGRRVARFISLSTWLPFSLPGTALALGVVWVILSFSFMRPLYGTFAVMLVALVIVAMPIAMRSLEPAALQVARSLEEAAWVSGAGKIRAFFKIVGGLALPSFAAGWLLCGILISGNLTMPLMVGSSLLETVPRRTFTLYNDGQAPMAAALSVIFLIILALIGVAGFLAARVLRHRRQTTVPASKAPVIQGVTHA